MDNMNNMDYNNILDEPQQKASKNTHHHSPNKKNSILITVVAVVLLAIIAGCVLYAIRQSNKAQQTQQALNDKSKELKEIEEVLAFEKEQVANEYANWVNSEINNKGLMIQNDSLAAKLQEEQDKVQNLLEELRITKATDAKRIAELKQELASVRVIMQGYVREIDSLYAVNQQLTQENNEVRLRHEEVTRKNEQLTQANQQLTQVVEIASMMKIDNFNYIKLNDKDRKTNSFSKTKKLEFDFTVLENITTARGQKEVYLRLIRPDGELLQKNENHLFQYENQQIGYSLRGSFEFGGESIDMKLYWTVEEVLPTGTYNADFFIDGNLVGSFPFTL